MIETIKIEDVVPATYNPRIIDKKSFLLLQESIKVLGFIVPIIVNRKNMVIVAGHQRTKAAKEVGISEVPAFFVDDIQPGDEIKFNQFHNGVDSTRICDNVIPFCVDEGFQTIDVCAIDTSGEDNALTVRDICMLILKYGNVFCAVATPRRIIMHADYIKACQLLKVPANVSVISEEKLSAAEKYLGAQYGKYSYDHLKKDTFVQGLAQMHRLAGGNKKQNRSYLYEKMALPYIEQSKPHSVLDFGCGKGAYIERVVQVPQKLGLEFYNNNGTQINVSKGNAQIDALIEHLRQYGRFDVVVCDSVLNSVDCIEAEDAVMTCICALSKGKVFFSGRSLDGEKSKMQHKKKNNLKKYRLFLDDNNFSADYRKGKWYYQHFHDVDGIKDICKRHGLRPDRILMNSNSWQCEATIITPPTKEKIVNAVDYEFNLPLPGGKRYARNDDMLRALKEAGIV